MPVLLIQQASVYTASELHADHDLQRMDRHTFIERLAYHYDQFNTGGSALLGEELIGAHDE